jgi:hypothetical protein
LLVVEVVELDQDHQKLVDQVVDRVVEQGLLVLVIQVVQQQSIQVAEVVELVMAVQVEQVDQELLL